MALVATDISVSFGGLKALRGVGLSIEPGMVVGLVGPNGAGKTTLFNCVTGVVSPDSGRVQLNGTDISRIARHKRVKLGLGRTFQTPRVNPDASVLDAVMLGFFPTIGRSLLASFLPLPSISRDESVLRKKAEVLIREFELTDDPETPVSVLSLGSLRLLEVARAIANNPQYLLLDEPAAGVDGHDRDLLAAAIRKAASRGIGVLLVEHNVGFVAQLCDQMIALVNGEMAASGAPADVVNNKTIVEAYLGAQRIHV